MANPGIIHKYYSNLVAFEHANSKASYYPKVVVFIGGLGDGITTVPYTKALSEHLDQQGWGFVEILTSSSFFGYGNGSLARDGNEIAKLVSYLREKAGKSHVVLLGHSTGTQNCIYYATQNYKGSEYPDIYNRPKIDGIILQASVSDREAFIVINNEETYKKALEFGEELYKKDLERIAEEKKVDPDIEEHYSQIPVEYARQFFNPTMGSYRWVSLLRVRGDDDFFSTDLDDVKDFKEKTFGKLRVPILVVYSGEDEFVPEHVDKHDVVKRFQKATPEEYWSPLSRVIPNATHTLDESPKEAVDDLIATVGKFLESLKL